MGHNPRQMSSIANVWHPCKVVNRTGMTMHFFQRGLRISRAANNHFEQATQMSTLLSKKLPKFLITYFNDSNTTSYIVD